MSLPKPIGRQREVLYLPEQGHFVVLGTAGSGKTTLAILRSAYLSRNGERTLLVTFNRALVSYLRSVGSSQLSKVDVRNYHRFARGYLNSKGKMGFNSIIDNDLRQFLIREAVNKVKGDYTIAPKILDRPIESIVEEIQWMAKSGISSLSEYVEAERIGRAQTRILRQERTAVYKVYEEYLNLRSRYNKDYDWDDIAQAALTELELDGDSRMYKNVVIDEGQDFSPVMLRSLAKAIPSDGSLTFFGDVAQQIYGTRISWRTAGLNVSRVWEFKENYRNTRQIARLGLAITEMPYFRDTSDLVEPRTPVADGPLPTLVRCNSDAAETQLVIDQAAILGRTQSVAVLMRDRDNEQHIIQAIQKKGINAQRLHRDLKIWTAGPGVYVGTYHSAKGLEFDAVLLPYCRDTVIPDESRIVALDGIEDAMSEEGRLLYVAVTRSKTRLILTYSGTVTPLLPTDSSLYEIVAI